MPIHTQWHDQRASILKVVFVGRWTAEEFAATIDAVEAETHAANGALHLLLDAQMSAGIPQGFGLIPLVARALSVKQIHHVVIVGGSTGGLKLARAMTGLFPVRQGTVFFAPNIDAGFEALLERIAVERVRSQRLVKP